MLIIQKLLNSILEDSGGAEYYYAYINKKKKKKEEEVSESMYKKREVERIELDNDIDSFKGKTIKNHVSLTKARLKSHSQKANLKREITNSLKSEETGGVNLNSDLIKLPLKHYSYKLNRSTPFTWEIYPSEDKLIIKIGIDKATLSSNDNPDMLVTNELKNNSYFKKMLRAIRDFEPKNGSIKDLSNLEDYSKKEKENSILYSKILEF